jgi:pimeloyl-ACP methyl ester carboxylesterase
MLAFADTAIGAGPTASTQAWVAGGGRVGYDPKARSIVAAQDAALKIFLRREGDVAHAVSFLPGFPDGSFGWAKVCPHLPSATEMPKLFVEYVGMGDSDKPKDYAYSTAECSRTALTLALTLSWHFLTSGRALDMIDERKKQAAELARQF